MRWVVTGSWLKGWRVLLREESRRKETQKCCFILPASPWRYRYPLFGEGVGYLSGMG